MYEQGVIRPPSEANSLLLRVTRNCPWNQCLFCPAYKGTKFSRRTVDEVKKDIDAMAAEYRGYAVRTAFFQDGDSLLLPTADVLEILRYLKEKFPGIERVTTYARAPTLRKKSVEDLILLREAGLTRVHAGMESGSEKVLKMIKKGITPEDIVEGGRHVVEAGISLSEYIMPGVGGRGVLNGGCLQAGRCGDGSLATWLRAELRTAGFALVAPEPHASPIIVTVQLPAGVRAEDVGSALEQLGIVTSYRSGYLLARNWIQASLMVQPPREALAGMIAHLCDLAGMGAYGAAKAG